MIAKIAGCAVISLALAAPAFAVQGAPGSTQQTSQQTQQQQISQQTKQFMQHLAKDNQGEIESSVLAEKQAQAPAVKGFARLMVDDHMALESQLAVVAGKLQVPLPDGVTQSDQQAMQKLSGISGQQFDQAYMQENVTNHQKDVQQIEQHLQQAHNPEVRGLLMGALPIIQQHLALAQAVNQSLSGQGSGAQAYNAQH